MNLKSKALNDKQLAKLDELLNELTEFQMIWLSGFIEGRLTSVVKSDLSVKQVLNETVEPVANLTILYGTETGNCQVLADKMAEKSVFKNIKATVYNMYEYEVDKLAKEDNIAVIVSTHGEGEVPEMVDEFYEFITGDKVDTLENVSFSVLALGDKTYKYFC